jgi:hypothetical protein
MPSINSLVDLSQMSSYWPSFRIAAGMKCSVNFASVTTSLTTSAVT